MIQITKLTITYQSEHKLLTAEQFRGAFSDYIRANFTKAQQDSLPMSLAYNKDKKGNALTQYSLMQYKSYTNKFEIIALAEGEQILNAWLDLVLKQNNFEVNGKKVTLSNPIKTTRYWKPSLEKHQLYKITNWLPFGKDNLGKEVLFDKIIWGNIMRLIGDLKIEFKTDRKICVHILEYKRKETKQKGYDVQWLAYDVIFSTNINLPEHIGLGRIISLGNGKVTKVKLL